MTALIVIAAAALVCLGAVAILISAGLRKPVSAFDERCSAVDAAVDAGVGARVSGGTAIPAPRAPLTGRVSARA
jgi:hypothetical protein